MQKDTASSAKVGLPSGTKIGKYEIVERFAIGGQAILYKAYDALLDRHVAIKQISSHLAEDPEFMERFRREAQILAKLGAEQPCIVTIHDLIEDTNGLFIVMEYVQGNSLATIIADTNGPTQPKAALQVLWRLAGALHAVHSAGIIHRDIKPGNVIIAEGLWPTIMDFGVAASISGQTSMVLGTTRYMAPELFGGGVVDGRVDMYSLGFVMYELLVGKPKFDEIFADVIRDERSATMRWMKWHGNAAVQAPLLHEIYPEIPVALSHIVARMIAKDPDERFENMEELGKAIKGAFSPRGRGGRAATVAPPPSMVAAGVGAAGTAEGGIALDGDEPTFDPEPTVRLPKSSLSLRTKLILLGGVLAGVLALVITISVKRAKQRAAFEAKVNALYKPIAEGYENRKWQAVLEAHTEMTKAVAADEQGEAMKNTVQMGKAEFMAKLSGGQVAVKQKVGNWWATAFKASREAKKALESVESRFAKSVDDVRAFDNWLDESHRDLRDFEDQYLKVRSMEDLIARAEDAKKSKDYAQALELLSEESLRDRKLKPNEAQKQRIAALREEIKQEEFMDTFRAIAVKAEELYQDGKGNLPKARIEFERALAAIDTPRAREVVPQAKRAEITGQLKTKIAAIGKALKERDLLAALETAKRNKDPLAIKKAVDDLVAFAPGHPRNKGLVALVNSVMDAQARAALIKWLKANAATNQNTAVLKIKRWLKDHPNEPPDSELRTMLGNLERGMDLAARVRTAVSTYRSGKWAEAIPLLNDLMKYPSASTGIERTQIRAWLKECDLQILWAQAEALKGKSQYRQAIAVYQKILEKDKTWKRQEIMRIVDELTQKQSYDYALGRAKEAYGRKQYTDAISWAKKVLEIKRTSVEALKIITDSRYEQQMTQGRARIEQRDYRGALAYFTVAHGIKKTDEAKKLIADMKAKISGSEP